MYTRNLPIGVFDSGVGGLTVLKALKATLPNEHFLYLGDTARLPYGTKTPQTVSSYAIQAVSFLLDQGIKLLVVACNTATALALPALKEHFPTLPIIGVIEPSAQAALAISQNKRIAVLATQATVNSKGYEQAILHQDVHAKVLSKPATLLVALAEEGLLAGDISRLAVQHYLEPILNDKEFQADTLVLGCTHFPVLQKVIKEVVVDKMKIVDSAQSVAMEVEKFLLAHPDLLATKEPNAQVTRFLVTDGVGRFMQVAEIFLEAKITADDVSLVDI